MSGWLWIAAYALFGGISIGLYIRMTAAARHFSDDEDDLS